MGYLGQTDEQGELAQRVTQENLLDRFLGRVGRETKQAFGEEVKDLPESLYQMPGAAARTFGRMAAPHLSHLMLAAGQGGEGNISDLYKTIKPALSALGAAFSPVRGLGQAIAQTPVEERWGPTAETLGLFAGALPEIAMFMKAPLTIARRVAPVAARGVSRAKAALGLVEEGQPFVTGARRIKGPYPRVAPSKERLRAEEAAQDVPPRAPAAVEGNTPPKVDTEAPFSAEELIAFLEKQPFPEAVYPTIKDIFASLRSFPRPIREAFTGKGAKPVEYHKLPASKEGTAWQADAKYFNPKGPETRLVKRRDPEADVIATGPHDPEGALYSKIQNALRHENVHALMSHGRLPEPVRGKLLEDAINIASMFQKPTQGPFDPTVGGYVRGVWGLPIFKYMRTLPEGVANPEWAMTRAEGKYTEGLAQAVAPGISRYAPEIPLEARTAAIDALRMASKRLKAFKRQQRAKPGD